MAGVKGKSGPKSTFNIKDATEIVKRLSKGEPLASICRDDHMPAVRTVSDWKDFSPKFAADFVRARDEGFDAIAADCLEIADDKSGDIRIVGGEDDEGREVCNTEFVQRSKLRIETRLRLLAKWDPKRYGDKQQLEHSDPQGNNPFAPFLEMIAANGRPRPGS